MDNAGLTRQCAERRPDFVAHLAAQGLRWPRQASAVRGSSSGRGRSESICCSPPDSWSPQLRRRSRKPREELVDALQRPVACAIAGRAARPGSGFLRRTEIGKDAAPFRHEWRGPCAADGGRASPRDQAAFPRRRIEAVGPALTSAPSASAAAWSCPCRCGPGGRRSRRGHTREADIAQDAACAISGGRQAVAQERFRVEQAAASGAPLMRRPPARSKSAEIGLAHAGIACGSRRACHAAIRLCR